MLLSRVLTLIGCPCLWICLCLTVPATAQDRSTGPLASDARLRPLQTADAARDWAAVGRLDTGVSFCSATLIAPDLVLTAAHCLFTPTGAPVPPGELIFSASLRNGRAEAYRNIARTFMPDAYIRPDGPVTYDTVSDDLALLELAHPIAAANIAPIPAGSRGRTGDLVTVVSYGRDREAFASIEEDCHILASHARVQVLSCSVVSGASGAPILRRTADGMEVIGVVSATGSWNATEAAIAIAIDGLLPPLIAARGASRGGAFDRTQGPIRRLRVGDDSRDGIGARFLRP